jgi:hypothetical protein
MGKVEESGCWIQSAFDFGEQKARKRKRNTVNFVNQLQQKIIANFL